MTMRTLTLGLLSALLMLAWPLAGNAHTHMEKSEPADKSVLTAAPTAIQLWFSEKISAEWSKIEVTDAAGTRVDKQQVTADSADPKHIQTELNPLTAGEYQVKWNVISGDGHRVKGTFSFTVQ
jgi:methionine-rich copper-binding protein CopC